jgi:hypothetical protein
MARGTSTPRAAERNCCDTADEIEVELAVDAPPERGTVSPAASYPAMREHDPMAAEAERRTGPPHSPHRPVSEAALEVARRLFAATDHTRADDAALIASAERICGCVPDGLARWFGPYGSLALVSRALAIAEASHPALAAVSVSTSPAPRLIGVSASAKSYGTAATSDAIITLLATLYELLGRLIGDDMALVLLEQCAVPSASPGHLMSNGDQRVATATADPVSGGVNPRDARPAAEELSQTMDEQ